ncbi:hypothetical protein ACQKP8_26495 [Photobacterium alginatilyticum]|uniref:hypothetical protein n=1 Tax=Photobacterium alginatilyticum TaxID=1775171 RepID=UPI004067C256
MKKIIFSGLILAMISGCASVQEQTRISTTLKASEYNSIASKYMERPTFTSIEKFSTGEEVLAVSMDTYGVDSYGNTTSTIRYSNEQIDEYMALIDKYIKWEAIAVSRKDAITREIGNAKAWSNGVSAYLKFNFHSGNEYNHYLSVSFCATVCLDEQAQYYTKKDAVELKDLLNNMKLGKLEPSNIDDVYN